VTPTERKVSEAVVESGFIERSDVRIAPLVLGVADSALLLLDSTVIAPLLDGITRDVLVAVEAQTTLCALIEAHMTLFAVGFQIGMTSNDFSRHQHALHRIRMARGNKWKQQRDE